MFLNIKRGGVSYENFQDERIPFQEFTILVHSYVLYCLEEIIKADPTGTW